MDIESAALYSGALKSALDGLIEASYLATRLVMFDRDKEVECLVLGLFVGNQNVDLIAALSFVGWQPTREILIAHAEAGAVLSIESGSNRHERIGRSSYAPSIGGQLNMTDIETLTTAMADDDMTYGHIRRVQINAVRLARAVGIEDESTLDAIDRAALLHDVGKLAVPKTILNKPGALTPSEFEIMKLHVQFGVDILADLETTSPVVPIVRSHHENWDGTGYPRGLSGTDIPLGARILSVVDSFDAMTSDRPYRTAVSGNAALQALVQDKGTRYDPAIVDTFTRMCQSAGSTVDAMSGA